MNRDGTIWLKNGQHKTRILAGDRVYLWSSGLKNPNRSIGRLVTITIVEQPPPPHAQHEWQAQFRVRGEYDPLADRTKLRIQKVLTTPIPRSAILRRYPEVTIRCAAFKNGPAQTTLKIEPDLERTFDELVLESN